MTSQHDKPKRWRLRFSVRTLVVVVTFVCCYAACWGPTKTKGVQDIVARLDNTHWTLNEEAVAPLVVRVDQAEQVHDGGSFRESFAEYNRHYYIWFFGCVKRLPYKRKVDQPFNAPYFFDD